MIIHKAHIDSYNQSFYREAFQYLSDERRQRALRYQNTTDRLSCILGDYLLRKTVCEVLNCPLKDVRFHHTESGRPYIAHPDDSGLHISLSHSGGWVIAAADSSPLGIDIEMIRDIDDAVIRHSLSPEESAYAGHSRNRFFEIWTMKEAYLKCVGTGIAGTQSLKSINVFGLPKQYRIAVMESSNDYVMSACLTSAAGTDGESCHAL